METTKKIAVIGFGTIGTGVADLLYNKGINDLELVRMVDVDLKRERPVKLPPSYLSSDWRSVVDDPDIDIIVELIGGIEPAMTIQMAALNAGKDVVTANKKLLAQEGQRIFGLASKLGRNIGFRASFVGCHSLINEFRQAGTAQKKFRRIYAILNGTSNYILSKMANEGMGFDEALKEAQAGGYAEADPSDDIDGHDTASKIRILIALISNSYHTVAPFPVEGVRNISIQDIQYAIELGYVIKLVGVIEEKGGVLNVSVQPSLVPQRSLLGSLEGVYNGTELEDEYGVVSGLIAPGAGAYPTADAVIKDLLDIADGKTLHMPDSSAPVVLGSPEDVERRYYLRFGVADQAGVLAQLFDIFWKHNISISAVIQKEPVSRDLVPVVMTTHLAREGNLLAAIAGIDKLEVVRERTRIIRILKADT